MPTNPSGAVDHTEVVGREGAQVSGLVERLRRDALDPIAAARLEEIHAARGDWPEVARLVIERAGGTIDPAERAGAMCRAAALHRVELGDGDGAMRLAEEALAICPDEPRVTRELEAIARLGDERARRVCAALARAAGECELGAPELAAALWLSIAAVELAVRRDPAAALAALSHLAPDSPDSIGERGRGLLDRLEREAQDAVFLDAVADLWRRAGEARRERRALTRGLELAEPLDRARRHRAVAALLAADGDADGAAWHEREAHRLDPLGGGPGDDVDHERSTARLTERYVRERRWHDLEPVIDRLARPGGLTPERLGMSRADLHYHAGRTALELGKWDKAIHHYRLALEFDPVHLAALVEQARSAAALERWDEVHDLLGSALLVQRSHGRPPAELAETLYRMGQAREKSGLLEAAVVLHESALDVAPAHPRALAAACRLHRGAGDLVTAERLLRAAVTRADGERRVELLVELAGLRSRFFGDAATAVEMCREALRLAPGDRRALLALVEHCQVTGQPAEALEAIAALAAGEPDPLRRGKYHQLAGGLAEAHAPDVAVRELGRALDCFFAPGRQPPAALRQGCMAAFRDLDRILRERREWRRLEREHRAMIKRLPPGARELPRLWAELGTIYRTHLGHGEAAIQSFEVASALDADRLTHHRVLIDLYQGLGTDELDKLIDRRRKLLAAEPFDPQHYAALRALWAKTRDRDRTFAACRALVFLGAADRSEEAFYRRHRRDRIAWPSRAMNEADWRRLRHPDEDPLVGAVMGLVAEPIALAGATTARRLRLRDDESATHDGVRHLFRQVARALGVGSPGLFVVPAVEADIVLANLRQGASLTPAFAVGCHMYQGRSSAQMVHAMSRALSYARPVAYLRLLLGGTGQLGAVWAAARICAVRSDATQGISLDGAASEMQEVLERRAHRGLWLTELRAALRRVRQRVEVPVDVERWGRGVDATARRAGLLLAGELDVAAADLPREPLFAQRARRDQRLADLLLHSVSEEHIALRRDLGLSVD